MDAAGASDVENVLMKTLLGNYNPKVRPAKKMTDRVLVRVGMTLASFGGLVRAAPRFA